MTNYIVATIRPWHIAAFHRAKFGDNWHLVTDPVELPAAAEAWKPRYIFFPHWSWKVPPEIYERYECVCFHETAVPFGRGGSPVQNLIARGITETEITALRMVEEMDAGPVYMQRLLSLHGGAEEIYLRSAGEMIDMIRLIARYTPAPVPQLDMPPEIFRRRTPEDSRITPGDLERLHDHIRMLDAEGYPPAFLEFAGFRFEFTCSTLRTGRIEANVVITESVK